jgi:site-specific DNA recombinase
VLDSHRSSGDRSHKHHHYLKGTLYCICGKRLGYGRHKGKCGGHYEYFSCLSRVQRGERCAAPYFPVERTERAIVRRYRRVEFKNNEQETVRDAVRTYVQSKSEIARRESERHNRRLHELLGEQQSLVQLYYKGGVSEEVLKAEQERIEAERAQAQEWADAAEREVEDVMAALEDALLLLNVTQIIYEALPANIRRLVNQAVFLALVVRDPDTIDAQRTPFFEALHQLAQALLEAEETPQTGQKRPRTPQDQAGRPQDDHDPDFRGRGSYIGRMAGATGLEPATSAVTGQRSNLLSYAPAMLGAPGRRSVPPQYAKAGPQGPRSPETGQPASFRLRFRAWRSSVQDLS